MPYDSSDSESDNNIPLIELRKRRLSEINTVENIIDCDGYDSEKDKDYVPSDSDNESNESVYSKDSCNAVRHVCADTVNDIENGAPQTNIPKPLKRKRQRNPVAWKCNIRKEAHDTGKKYVSVRKKVVPAKRMKTVKDCWKRCLYKCQTVISEDERKTIFDRYYTLNGHGKKMFILSTTNKFTVERRRKNKTDTNSRRSQTFAYYFQIGSGKIQVCKKFYLSTLDISQTPIYTAHSKRDNSNIPDVPKQGKYTKHKIPDDAVNFVKQHIESFPKVDSHYCRANTQRQYLEPNLNIKKMYSLYVEFCEEANKQPVKESFYRKIFCNEYNLFFHEPKKDRCDLCEEVKINKKENVLTDEKKQEYDNHIKEKTATRAEKRKDRESSSSTFLVFDLQNVLPCPKVEISNFYYKSKLNVYNLTAILSSTKQVYCAIWHEMLMGRAGNDIASAVVKILEAVFTDNQDLRKLILWSDSCVPQNRNSLMTYAITFFLNQHPMIESITMKFSTPGHSCVQEIDSVHSCIERIFSKTEYYSPVSLLRLLLKVNSSRPYKVMQMKAADFKDFKSCTSGFNYKVIPFSKVSALKFTSLFTVIEYKESHQSSNWTKVSIRSLQTTRSGASTQPKVPKVVATDKKTMSADKVKAIKSMYRWMPLVDKTYFEAVLPKI